MNIIVTIKQVADPNIPPNDIQLDPEAKRIVSPFGIPPVMNGYDANALEAALRLREKHGGRITAVGLGDDTSRAALKHAIAMGADSAVLLNDPDWLHADSAGVGLALAGAIRKIGNFDLLLCGRQASDTDGGQVLHWIAEVLDLPAVSPVSKIEEVDGRTMIVHRLIEDGYQRLRVELPALLGVSSETNEPRYPSIRGTLAAGRTLIPGWKASDLGLAASSPKVELRQLQIQLRTSNAELIEGSSGAAQGAALADKLRELGLI
ncbi:MAG: electron transfer flavoprotein subunit beta/FixA family protein [Sulfuricaulis sp.]|nr:electron transfer flavoprotein subunit beta/FixA family protein [Sulfuricaulis sp.]